MFIKGLQYSLPDFFLKKTFILIDRFKDSFFNLVQSVVECVLGLDERPSVKDYGAGCLLWEFGGGGGGGGLWGWDG